MSEQPCIECTPDGALRERDRSPPARGAALHAVPLRRRNKPFCDGSHSEAQFADPAD